MEPLLNLNPFDAKESLIQQTVAQIARDFGMFGMEINFPEPMEMAYPQVFNQVQLYLNAMLASDNNRLASLLYHIDIPESAIMEAWNQHPEISHSSILSELIIFREFKKVIYRNHYRDQKNPDQITT